MKSTTTEQWIRPHTEAVERYRQILKTLTIGQTVNYPYLTIKASLNTEERKGSIIAIDYDKFTIRLNTWPTQEIPVSMITT